MKRADPKSGSTVRPLTAFLRQKRGQVPAARTTKGRGNYRPGLSQRDLALRIGMDVRHWRRIEVGDALATDQILGLVCSALSLTDLDSVQLWRLALRRDPPAAYLIDSARLTNYWEWLVPRIEARTGTFGDHLVVGPAVGVVKLDSEHLAYNDAYRELFAEGHPPANLFRWLAHDGAAQLPDHSKVWLPSLLPDLRAQLELFPDDEGLLDLARWCGETPSLRDAWAAAKPFFSSPDGGIFPFVHPEHGLGAFEVGVLSTDSNEVPGLRIFFNQFHVDVTCDLVRKLRDESGARS